MWSLVDLPVGRHKLPDWALGLHIEWMDRWANAPDMKLKTNQRLRSWDGQKFRKQGDMYIAEHHDGRADVYYHSGRISMVNGLRRYDDNGRVEIYSGLATTQQDGFGGAHYPLLIDGGEYDGQIVTLRGPWHGCSPDGFIELSYVNVAEDYNKPCKRRPHWYSHGGVGGLYLRIGAFLPIFARYQPHLRLAQHNYYKSLSVEPMKPDWELPKTIHNQHKILLSQVEHALSHPAVPR
jgi:hypothetical protein